MADLQKEILAAQSSFSADFDLLIAGALSLQPVTITARPGSDVQSSLGSPADITGRSQLSSTWEIDARELGVLCKMTAFFILAASGQHLRAAEVLSTGDLTSGDQSSCGEGWADYPERWPARGYMWVER